MIDALYGRGHGVYATKLPFENISNKNATVCDLDITDRKQTEDLICEVKPEVIFHLAAQSSVKVSWEKPQLTANINILGAINLFEAVRKINKEIKIIVIGSSEEYGCVDYSKAISEEALPDPQNIYALTKYSQELLAKIYCDAYCLKIIMTRSFNHFGPRQSRQFVVADFCGQVADIEREVCEPVIKVGNLSAYRDFTDVRDIVEAYILLAEKGEAGGIYNVGSGKAIQIKDILSAVIKLSCADIQVITDKSKFRPVDIPKIEADITKIRRLGWEPKIPLKKSLTDTLEYFRKS